MAAPWWWHRVLVHLGFETEIDLTVIGSEPPVYVPPWLDEVPEPPARPPVVPAAPEPAAGVPPGATPPATAPRGGAPHVVHPREPAAMVEVGSHLRANEPVVLDLRDVEPALRRRFIDVSAGLVYGMEGRMARGHDEQYVLWPSGAGTVDRDP